VSLPTRLLLAVFLSCLSAAQGVAADGSACRVAAADTASIVRLEAETVEQRRREFRDCLFFPELYDTRGDRCATMRVDYQYAKRRYVAAKTALDRELSDPPCSPIP
jgi:hypothetical protein